METAGDGIAIQRVWRRRPRTTDFRTTRVRSRPLTWGVVQCSAPALAEVRRRLQDVLGMDDFDDLFSIERDAE